MDPSSNDLTRFRSDSVTGISFIDTISSYFLRNKKKKSVTKLVRHFNSTSQLNFLSRSPAVHHSVSQKPTLRYLLISVYSVPNYCSSATGLNTYIKFLSLFHDQSDTRSVSQKAKIRQLARESLTVFGCG